MRLQLHDGRRDTHMRDTPSNAGPPRGERGRDHGRRGHDERGTSPGTVTSPSPRATPHDRDEHWHDGNVHWRNTAGDRKR